MASIKSVNECVIRFANTNGTGSASANGMFAKAIFRMGIPVSPANIFPSNIQGMSTWYDVRISAKDYMARREGSPDIVVAMNAQSMADDVRNVRPGGFLFYDSSRQIDPALMRQDITFLGMPISEICLREYQAPNLRQLFKNVIYVGALAALLDIDFKVLKDLVADQFKGKEKLVAPNVHALELGYQYATTHFSCPLSIRLEPADKIGSRILIDGNTATGLGAVYGGATVVGWYPITPSTSVVENFEKYCKRLRIDPASGKNNFAIMQAEDELSAIGIAIGAGWNGARSFTATSGPGVSLMAEFLGLAYFAEVPMVLMNVQRAGPSTGMPTRTQQSDVMTCAYASHGDTKQVLLFPSSPAECFQMSAQAFDLAEQLQTPIILMSDLDLGMNDQLSDALTWDDKQSYDRGKVLNEQQLDEVEQFGRYLDVDGDGICYRTYPGTHPDKGIFFTRGTSRDEFAIYTEKGDEYVKNMQRLERKFETAVNYLPKPILHPDNSGSRTGVIYYGMSDVAMTESFDLLKEQGHHVDGLCIKSFPFGQSVQDFIDAHDQVFVVDQNRDGQMRKLLIMELEQNPAKLVKVAHYDGMPITAAFISQSILKDIIAAPVKRVTKRTGS
ncbi:MAG: 2-oxoacid:acceptor oxidoreductase subunit alpha [Rhodobacteraceae bacterium]|nr:2-oxoacid:acceptor oxidoreductase subunit alpha [Paracoccaceae bacterium]